MVFDLDSKRKPRVNLNWMFTITRKLFSTKSARESFKRLPLSVYSPLILSAYQKKESFLQQNTIQLFRSQTFAK